MEELSFLDSTLRKDAQTATERAGADGTAASCNWNMQVQLGLLLSPTTGVARVGLTVTVNTKVVTEGC